MTEQTLTRENRRPSKWVMGFLLFTWALLSFNLVATVCRFQPNVLTWDQWDFFKPLFEGSGWRELFTLQHGPHRQGLGFVVTSWVLAASHWDSRWDSLWITSLLSLASLLALRLRYQLTGRLSVFDVWIPMAGLGLSQFEAILITPNASHSAFPLALMMIVANVWHQPSAAVRYGFAGLAAVALTFTGFGIFSGAVLAGLLGSAAIRHLLNRHWKDATCAIVGFALSVAGFVAFKSGYVFAPAVDGFKFPWTPVADYGRFIALMLVHPAGVAGEGTSHYVAGGVIAIVLLTTTAVVVWRWISTSKTSLEDDVLILLLGSGLLFVCNTAVGRIPLGVTAGMSSRYVTLMFPLWLGVYLAGTKTPRVLPAAVSTMVVGCIALWPCRDMLARPKAQWMGTIGATKEQYTYFEEYTFRKAAWVDRFLKSGSWQEAQGLAGEAVYPDPRVTHMDDKLQFLRQHQLSFFKPPGGPSAFLPWWLNRRTIWDNEFPSINVSHPLEQRPRLITFITREPGFIEVEVRSGGTAQVTPVPLEFSANGKTEVLIFKKLPEWISVPVSPGFNRLTIRRAQPDNATASEIPIQLEMRPSTGPAERQRSVLR